MSFLRSLTCCFFHRNDDTVGAPRKKGTKMIKLLPDDETVVAKSTPSYM